MENLQASELTAQAAQLYQQAKGLLIEGGAENIAKAEAMIADAKATARRAAMLSDIEAVAREQKGAAQPARTTSGKRAFGSMADFATAVYNTKRRMQPDPRLVPASRAIKDDGADPGGEGWIESKTLAESVGADGGFLVPEEFLPQLFMLSAFGQHVRERALVLPMRHRQLTVPYLDQSGTAVGKSNLYGGVQMSWTEEAAEKSEAQPKFRQMSLVAHKLAAVTYASDELLEDSAIELEALLVRLFASAISNEHDWAFINGTGAGQPLGVVTATGALGPTITVAPAVAGSISIADIFNMLTAFTGQNPVWLAHQSTMPEILGLAGPATNASYVWIANARDAAPVTLMGFPVYFTENCPTLGEPGSLILADWSKYVIGERKATTIDASNDYRFAYDVTTWRAVSRIDGRPWLAAPLTLRDGVTEVSPFVILGGQSGS